jgi:hypothetical protein
MLAVDDEGLAIARAVTILAEPDLGVRQGYMTEPSYQGRPSPRGRAEVSAVAPKRWRLPLHAGMK